MASGPPMAVRALLVAASAFAVRTQAHQIWKIPWPREASTRPTEADDVQTECHPTTLVCDNPSSPSWKHEKIAFYVGNGKHLRRPLAVQIELHATDSPAAVGALLASGVVHLSECCSEATAALTPTDLLQAAPTVVFCAQVGPWLDE